MMRDVTRGDRRGTIWRAVALPLAALSAVFATAPARAELLPPPDQIASPEEQAMLDSVFASMRRADGDGREKFMAALDEALARLTQPTKLRGFVQLLRASTILDGSDGANAAAREAADESVRLLPGYSGPLLTASRVYGFSGLPGQAADYLIRASQIDPVFVSKLNEYEINNIFNRLSFAKDGRRSRLLSERLLEIGWTGASLDSRSSMAVRAIEGRMAEDDLAGAKRLVAKLINPADSVRLLAQNEYRELWPAIEQWAGPALETQWRIYLDELRANWEASPDPASARAYARALSNANHNETIAREILPIFLAPLDKHEDYELIYVASTVADALAKTGRWKDVETLYDRAARTWKLGDDANALNIAGNRARFMLYADKPAEALAAMDAVIADAKRWGGEVNGDALTTMRSYRACMLHATGKDSELNASRLYADSLDPVSAAFLNLCLDRPEQARDILIAGLDDEAMRESILIYVQPSRAPPMQSAYGRQLNARYEALRSDPKLLAAVARYGRIVPFTLDAGAPAELSQPKPL